MTLFTQYALHCKNTLLSSLITLAPTLKIYFDLAKRALVSLSTHSSTACVNFDYQGVDNFIYVFTATIMYSYLFYSTKTEHPATHLSIYSF